MRNTMNVSYKTRRYQEFLDKFEGKKNQKPTERFQDKVVEKSEERKEQENVSQTLNVNIVSTKEMTLEEYKQYIYNKISELPMHPSNRNDFIAVQISDAGFRAMKEDPDYEKWVLDTLQKDFMCYDPWSGKCGGKYVIHTFGAAKEAYRGESWRMDCEKDRERYNRKVENSFWERRAKRRKQLKEEYEKLLEKRLLEKKLYEKQIYEKKLQQKRYEAGVAQSKAEANQQSQEWYHKKQLLASSIYEESSVVEIMEHTNFIG